MKKNLLALSGLSLFLALTMSCSSPNSNNSQKEPEFVTKLASDDKLQAYSFFIRYNKGNTPVKFSDSGYIDFEKSTARNAISEQDEKTDSTDFSNFRISGNPILEQKNQKIWKVLKESINSSRSESLEEPKMIEVNKTSYELGATKQFWIYDAISNKTCKQQDFILKSIGNHCLVWYEKGLTGDNEITDENSFTKIKEKFDFIYDIETDIFGKAQDYLIKYPSKFINKIDDKIHIVLMNPESPSIAGFFNDADLYYQKTLDDLGESEKSNENQIIYINSFYVNKYLNESLTTVAHEFQHLLGFIHDTIYLGETLERWYTEMLSVLSEDIFHEILSPDSANPYGRLELFKTNTNYGVTYWTPAIELTDDKQFISYAVNYAFGAFLFRNYNNIELLKAMTSYENKAVNKGAINYALKKVFPDKNYTFDSVAKNLFYTILYALYDGNDEKYKNVFTLNREIKFNAGPNNQHELTVKRIDLLKQLESDDIQKSPSFVPAGKDEIDVIHPYGFLLSDIRQCGMQKVVYQKPYSDNIEIMLF